MGEWCFEVTNVTLAGATYDSGLNIVTKACESGPSAKNSIDKAIKTDNINLNVYSNPFQNSTQIKFQLSQQKHVALEVYTVLGNKVAVITNKSYKAGQHLLDLNADNLAAGMRRLRRR